MYSVPCVRGWLKKRPLQWASWHLSFSQFPQICLHLVFDCSYLRDFPIYHFGFCLTLKETSFWLRKFPKTSGLCGYFARRILKTSLSAYFAVTYIVRKTTCAIPHVTRWGHFFLPYSTPSSRTNSDGSPSAMFWRRNSNFLFERKTVFCPPFSAFPYNSFLLNALRPIFDF